MRSFFKKLVNARTIDAFFRGISRGMATKTFVQTVGTLFQVDTTSPSTISVLPISLLTAYTSYTGTQWWTAPSEEAENLFYSNHASFFRTSQRVVDAFFRGVSRAEAVSNGLLLIGTLLEEDATLPAGILGLVSLLLTTWSSYHRTLNRADYVKTLLPLYEATSNESESHPLRSFTNSSA